MLKIKIAIDGPAASGKSTTAKRIAEELGYLYIDTGAMYRALTLAIIETGADIKSETELLSVAQTITIELKKSNSELFTFLNGKDVSNKIRLPKINQIISQVSAYPKVREIMVEKQRQLAQQGGVVMDGRDIGTVVLPDAEVKIYMIADVKKRALRRFQEMQKKGIKADLAEIENEIKNRDKIDSSRTASPLKPAEDSITIDTSDLMIQEQTQKCLELINNYIKKS